MAVPATIQQVISSLRELHGEEKIAKMVYDQLIKDFRTAGIELLLNDCDYHKWTVEISNAISGATAYNLSVLLYAVDIPEKIVSNFEDNEEFAAVILYREFVKIYFRLNYNL